jgi:uridine kinase
MKIIGISGVSGSGKTTLAKKLQQILHVTAIFWDDYDEISESPHDYVEWFKKSKDYQAWRYDALANTLSSLKNGKTVICPATNQVLIPTPIILFDAPLGYRHHATGAQIDFLIYLDTSPDIAMARRLLRDKPDFQKEMQYYLAEARPVYMLSYEQKNESNLVIDGNLPQEEVIKICLSHLETLNLSS